MFGHKPSYKPRAERNSIDAPEFKPSVPGRSGRPGPGRPGTIAGHPRRSEIEHDIAVGVPSRRVAMKYDISKDVVLRYKAKLPQQLKAKRYVGLLRATDDLEQLRIEESDNLLKNLAMQRARLLITQDRAMALRGSRNFSYVAGISGQIHKNLELTGRYLGEFAKRTVQTNVSILIQPEYLKLRAALLQALADYPDAKRAVANVLHEIEGAAAQEPVANGHDRVPAVIEARPIEVQPNA
jgi:hypothetical protein